MHTSRTEWSVLEYAGHMFSLARTTLRDLTGGTLRHLRASPPPSPPPAAAYHAHVALQAQPTVAVEERLREAMTVATEKAERAWARAHIHN